MNFFGHTWVAVDERQDAPFLFGTMIPDFVSMSGARLDKVMITGHIDAPEVRAGIRHHLDTDSVFHTGQPFVKLSSELTSVLESKGVRRGTSMAVGHVGIELLLDRWLLEQFGGEPYLEAIRYATNHVAMVELGDATPDFRSLIGRLENFGLSGYQSIERIRDRLVRALAGRPRLSIEPKDEQLVYDALIPFDNKVMCAAESWLAVLRSDVRALREKRDSKEAHD